MKEEEKTKCEHDIIRVTKKDAIYIYIYKKKIVAQMPKPIINMKRLKKNMNKI